MIDFHCHLDLYKDPISLLPEVKRHCRFVLAVTTSPRAWIKTSQVFSGIDCISVALGLHPEILTDKIKEQELFLTLIPKSQFLGEIGLDGTERNKDSLELQIDFFKEALQVTEKCGGRTISIHSRSVTNLTLDIVEKNIKSSIPVMHWFSGTDKELDWALSLNCWFSINPQMLLNMRGISLVHKVPLSRMIPETDGPFTTHNGVPYMPWNTDIVVEGIAKSKNLLIDEVSKTIIKNLQILCMKAK